MGDGEGAKKGVLVGAWGCDVSRRRRSQGGSVPSGAKSRSTASKVRSLCVRALPSRKVALNGCCARIMQAHIVLRRSAHRTTKKRRRVNNVRADRRTTDIREPRPHRTTKKSSEGPAGRGGGSPSPASTCRGFSVAIHVEPTRHHGQCRLTGRCCGAGRFCASGGPWQFDLAFSAAPACCACPMRVPACHCAGRGSGAKPGVRSIASDRRQNVGRQARKWWE